jgi:hypoxanthine phosphoribosyltransferase
LSQKVRVQYSPKQLSTRIAQMGREISRDYAKAKLDVVVILDSAFIFASDLVRHITVPTKCHFVRSEVRQVHVGGHERREIFFSYDPELAGRDVLVVDAVLHSGVTLDFLVKRLMESRPGSLRVAVLIDKPKDRKVDLKPDYFGFAAASNYLVGFGLPGANGLHRNLPFVGTTPAPRAASSKKGSRARRGGAAKARRVR